MSAQARQRKAHGAICRRGGCHIAAMPNDCRIVEFLQFVGGLEAKPSKWCSGNPKGTHVICTYCMKEYQFWSKAGEENPMGEKYEEWRIEASPGGGSALAGVGSNAWASGSVAAPREPPAPPEPPARGPSASWTAPSASWTAASSTQQGFHPATFPPPATDSEAAPPPQIHDPPLSTVVHGDPPLSMATHEQLLAELGRRLAATHLQ